MGNEQNLEYEYLQGQDDEEPSDYWRLENDEGPGPLDNIEEEFIPRVTITGVSGFLGSWTCLKFLESGRYRVRGTVRDENNEAKIAPLRTAFGSHFDQLELVEADLMNEQSIINAIKGSDYVVHVASPFFNSANEADVVRPAVNGTLAVMKACQQAHVRRCVITSSVAAVTLMAEADKPADNRYNETHWSNPYRPEGMGAYFKSKVLAEKAAWEF